MRYYIEEQVDWKWDGIKNYILSIKDFSIEELLDEIIKNIQYLYSDSDFPFKEYWIEDHKEWLRKQNTESLIATAVEEKFYVLNDEKEHEWNKHVVHSVLNNEKWIHRWNNVEY